MAPERTARAIRLLRAVTGIADVRAVDRPGLRRVAVLEERYGSTALLPILNLGVRTALQREVVLVVLKDRRFRGPPAPTVYLVEDLEGAPSGSSLQAGVQTLEVGERRFRILGEEVLDSGPAYTEKTMRLGESFVLFPERRSDPRLPGAGRGPGGAGHPQDHVRQSLGPGGLPAARAVRIPCRPRPGHPAGGLRSAGLTPRDRRPTRRRACRGLPVLSDRRACACWREPAPGRCPPPRWCRRR
jgi:hypothetical protein